MGDAGVESGLDREEKPMPRIFPPEVPADILGALLACLLGGRLAQSLSDEIGEGVCVACPFVPFVCL